MTNSIQKGKAGEREAAQAIGLALGIAARRSQQYSGLQEDSADLTVAIPGLYCEVKRYARIAATRWLKRAAKDAGSKLPLVLMREDRGEWVCMLRLSDARRLLDILNSQLAAETGTGRTGPEDWPRSEDLPGDGLYRHLAGVDPTIAV